MHSVYDDLKPQQESCPFLSAARYKKIYLKRLTQCLVFKVYFNVFKGLRSLKKIKWVDHKFEQFAKTFLILRPQPNRLKFWIFYLKVGLNKVSIGSGFDDKSALYLYAALPLTNFKYLCSANYNFRMKQNPLSKLRFFFYILLT